MIEADEVDLKASFDIPVCERRFSIYHSWFREFRASGYERIGVISSEIVIIIIRQKRMVS
jgi:hypothetical protein